MLIYSDILCSPTNVTPLPFSTYNQGKFVSHYFGRIFDNPAAAINEEMLKPELQSMEVFVDGIGNLVEAERKSALNYFKDDTIKYACPPLKALLHIMAYDHYDGISIHDSKIRNMFTRESLIKSDWYKERLVIKQQRDISLCKRHINALQDFLEKPGYTDEAARLGIHKKLSDAQQELARVMTDEYLKELIGTIGADPIVFEDDTVAQ